MSPLLAGLDAEATQQHTFSVAMDPDVEGAFFERPHVNSSGTLTFGLQQNFSGIVLLHIQITDDGNQPAVTYDGGDLGILDHAALKASENRNFSIQTLELVVSDALLKIQVGPSQVQHDATSQLGQRIAEALELRVDYVRWDASLDSFVVAYGRLQELLQVFCVICDFKCFFLDASSGASCVCKLSQNKGHVNDV